MKLLNRFIYFDFRAADANAKYLALAKGYQDEKSSQEFLRLKFNCGDIAYIYTHRLEDQLQELVHDPEKTSRVRPSKISVMPTGRWSDSSMTPSSE